MGKKKSKRKLAALRAPLLQQKSKKSKKQRLQSKLSKKPVVDNVLTTTTTTVSTFATAPTAPTSSNVISSNSFSHPPKVGIADVVQELRRSGQHVLPYPSQAQSLHICQRVGGKCKTKHVNNFVLALRQKKRKKRGLQPAFFYLILHKPRGYNSMRNNPAAKHPPRYPSSYTLFPDSTPAVPHVGRLDVDTEGLLMFTDDGKLLEALINDRDSVRAKAYTAKYSKAKGSKTKPKHREKVVKEYLVQVSIDNKNKPGAARAIDESVLEKMRAPLAYEDGMVMTRRADVTDATEEARQPNERLSTLLGDTNTDGKTHEGDDTKWLRIRIDQGKNRQIRRLCARENLLVHRLVRVAMGPIQITALPVGCLRSLTADEVASCYSKALPGEKIPEMLVPPLE